MIIKNLNKLTSLLSLLALFAFEIDAHAVNPLSWGDAQSESSSVSVFVGRVLTVVMAIFMLWGSIQGSITFSSLASKGDWEGLWSKISGSVGMILWPLAIRLLISFAGGV
jgi:hypothetical protein